jgi:uncharacterized membrane protein
MCETGEGHQRLVMHKKSMCMRVQEAWLIAMLQFNLQLMNKMYETGVEHKRCMEEQKMEQVRFIRMLNKIKVRAKRKVAM